MGDEAIDRRFDAVSECKFSKNVFQMTLDGGRADAQSECYLLISLCRRNES